MNNLRVIMQPHFNTNSFRVACSHQRGDKHNYVVVSCSPNYNGLYVWDSANAPKYNLWFNNNVACYVVPISDCKFIKPLDKLDPNKPQEAEVIKEVRTQQKKWFNGLVKNHKAYKGEEPDWFI